jgi:hypothetical protein
VKVGDRSYNQAHYEALGVCIGNCIEDLLVSKYGLKRTMVPMESEGDDSSTPRSHIYLSESALSSTGTLLVLVQGSGVVRPGQWSRSVIMNESLEVRSDAWARIIHRGFFILFPSLILSISLYG